MKTLLASILLLISSTVAFAQSSAVKNVANTTFTLTTFKADGSILATSNGVFISDNGEAVSPWKPFIGADHAVIINNKGERINVESLMGLNEIYDLVKFKVDASTSAPAFAAGVSGNSGAWIVTTSKSGAPVKTSVDKVEKFMNKYNYSILSYQVDEKRNGAAVVNDKGQLIGILNSEGNVQSATDAAFARDFRLTGVSQNERALRECAIRVALPETEEEAVIALMFSADKPEKYRNGIVQEFIKKFPKLNDGYFALANDYVAAQKLSDADKALQTSIANAAKKDEAHFNYAQIIYRSVLNPNLAENAKAQGWSLEKAMSEAQEAYKIKPENSYKHLQAQITYSQGDYQKAYNDFEALTQTDFKNPELYLEMAQSLQQMNGDDAKILQLLDESIAECDTPYVQTAAPFFYARGQQHDKMGNYRKAMQDFYTYEYFYRGQLDADFYYMRSKSESKGKLWQQALQDILIASRLNPAEPTYCAEAANLLLRVNKLDAAISAAEEAIKLAPQFADAYLVLGIAQCQNKQKIEGLKNIQKAKELGNTQADSFLEKFK